MEIYEFLEKFIPDFDSRVRAFEANTRIPFYKENGDVYTSALGFFCRDYFNEALQNYTNRVCVKQRALCADVVVERLDDHEAEPFEDGIYITSGDTLEADQPKIEEV